MAQPNHHGIAADAIGQRLVDPQGRAIDYLRLAVTDRCNLRCTYCMPAEGITKTARGELLDFEELTRVCHVLCSMGVSKIRITGGEPLLRKGLVDWLGQLRDLPGAPELLLTTNGLLLRESLNGLARAGVRRINLSLDSLREDTFAAITRRHALHEVLRAVDAVLERELVLKLNVVVVPGVNDDQLLDFVELARTRPLTVRFIEPMPFSGGPESSFVPFDGGRILAGLEAVHRLTPVPNHASAVDRLYAIEGYRGRVGIIEGHSRSFCGACSRLRVDPRGRLRTCLYGAPAADLRSVLRHGGSDEDLRAAVRNAIARRHVDGHAAERARGDGSLSMARIGG